MKVEVAHIHEKRFVLQIDWPELKEMILVNVRARLGAEELTPTQIKDAEFQIDIRQETTGSPAYSVSRWSATVRGVAAEGRK
ncbi:MAG: hypothetical protein HZY79_00300 [Rhodoblastus sp.]|nr:MAG: hypothetical protein HZY79_00300 [Rhodoblastus sp.]